MVDGGDQPRRRPLVGYAVAGAVVFLALVAVIVLLAGGTGDGIEASGGPDSDGDVVRTIDEPPEEDILPDGGVFATPHPVQSVEAAADAAGCELESFEVASRDHVSDLDADIQYSSNPPTSGRHYPVPAGDAAYEESPDVKLIVHTLEHSRVVVWFQPELPHEARAALKAFYDHDDDRMLLVPDTTDMPYEVAASAWHDKPKPNGTGRLLGCPEHNDEMFTALQAFKEANRGRGPEKIP